MKGIKEINGFKQKHERGFIQSEIDMLLKHYPDIDISKFKQAMNGVTFMMINGEDVYYTSDVEKALRCGMEKRNLSISEWD